MFLLKRKKKFDSILDNLGPTNSYKTSGVQNLNEQKLHEIKCKCRLPSTICESDVRKNLLPIKIFHYLNFEL